MGSEYLKKQDLLKRIDYATISNTEYLDHCNRHKRFTPNKPKTYLESTDNTDIDCISDGDIIPRNRYHRDELLPSQREREANLSELSTMTEDSEMEQNRINRMNHNNNITRVQQEETDYTDEEFAIMEARRRQRRPCNDYMQYLLR